MRKETDLFVRCPAKRLLISPVYLAVHYISPIIKFADNCLTCSAFRGEIKMGNPAINNSIKHGLELGHRYLRCNATSGSIRKIFEKTVFVCEKCGMSSFSFRIVENCEQQHIDDVIQRNIKIIMEAPQKFRRKIAIYRLYKTHNLSPNQISQYTKLSVNSIKIIIGEVFKSLCLSEYECPFKNYFHNYEKYHPKQQIMKGKEL